MKKYVLLRLWVLFIMAAGCTGCCTRANVTAGFSAQVKEYYSIYPTVEIDIAAVTESEAEEIQGLSVENYFAVGNSVRKRISPYTLTFSAEQTEPQTMKRGVDEWYVWLEKKPEKIVVLANLPRSSEKTTSKKDPRILTLDLKSSFLFPNTLYFEVKPGSIVQIYKKPQDPEAKAKKLKAEQEKSKKKKR